MPRQVQERISIGIDPQVAQTWRFPLLLAASWALWVGVRLLTDDKACQARAVADGLQALRAKDFVERMRPKFPEAGEKLAHRDDEEAAPPPAKRRRSVAGDGSVYPAHLKGSTWGLWQVGQRS